ncbi:hypothetical protein THAOC_35684, partial [Thalassiosira oceanica]
ASELRLSSSLLFSSSTKPPRPCQVVAVLRGGGVSSQAEGPAVRVGFSRADHVESPGHVAAAQHHDDPPPLPDALRPVHQRPELRIARDLGFAPPAVNVAGVVFV